VGLLLLKERKIYRNNPYLERQSLVKDGKFPSFQIPCLKSTALVPLAFPSPGAPASRQKDIYLHTDDINMPTILVRHKSIIRGLRMKFRCRKRELILRMDSGAPKMKDGKSELMFDGE
jgi:hypothetical protein